MARPTVFIHEDQLATTIAPLRRYPPGEARVLLAESTARARRLPFHKKRLVLVWSAMRHLAAELREMGYEVDYHEQADDYGAVFREHIRTHAPDRFVMMHTAEWGVSTALARLAARAGAEAEVLPSDMFLSSEAAFASWAEGKRHLRLETFYRRMRQESGILMEPDGEPAGGRWNYDRENRETPPPDHEFPRPRRFPPDAVTRAVMKLVARDYAGHFGTVSGFRLPVTRAGAEAFLADFLDHRLDLFGPYQDAMVHGEHVLYHSLLSSLLNIGLLDPLSCCQRAEQRWREGRARLSSVEGFVRQILGWREFVRQVYLLRMPDYAQANQLDAGLPLPRFFWDADTDLACVRDAVSQLLTHGSNHHIVRLMVTGNLSLLAGFDPQQVNRWYWTAYTDAWEWVVTPNVLGLALYADGGLLASKPYAASANYVRRMSDHCRKCRYDPRQTTGEDACPFNALYWDFLARHEGELRGNPRLNLVYAQLDRLDPGELQSRRLWADVVRARLASGDRV